MARSEVPRERLGEMLVSLGLITRAQLDEALAAQRTSALPLGKQLVALGSVNEIRLTQVLSNQLSVPWVSLERVEFPAELLARIPGELADRHSVMPIYVRHVRDHGATLYVAMDDPTHEAALREISEIAAMPVRPMIAPPSEIRRVIELRYFGASPTTAKQQPMLSPEPGTGLRSLPGRPPKPPPPAPTAAAADKTKRPGKPPPPPGPPQRKLEGVVAIEHYETPSQPPAAKGGRMLTLLDGTQIALPSTRYKADVPEIRSVRHVIKAIRATPTESDQPDEALRWHDILQAVIDATAMRGVRLTRDEIIAAWRRQKAKRDDPKPH
jgi:hypothetical protein